MTELLNVPGVWWLPETPDHKVPGWFTYDPEEGGTLRLSGSLRPLNWIENSLADGSVQRFIGHRPDEDRIYPRIHGQSGDLLLHMEDAFQLSLQDHLCREDDAAEKVHVNWVITGALFDGDGPPQVHRAVVELQHLTSWVDNDALTVDWEDLPEDVFAVATAHRRPTLRADLDDDSELAVVQSLGTAGDHRHDANLVQSILLTINATSPQRMPILVDRVSAFQDLLTIAAGKVANVETFHFTHNQVPKRSLAGQAIGNWKEELKYYTRWANRDSDRERVSPYSMLFTFSDFGGIDGVERWMRVADRYRSELTRVMAVRYNTSMFTEDRVANCVAALESFDRTRRESTDQDTNLRDRLQRCAEYAGETFVGLLGGEPIDEWTKRAKNHRHALGHHLDRFRDNMELIERELGDQLLWLALLCLLREADAPDAVFTGISNNSHFRWIGKRAAERYADH